MKSLNILILLILLHYLFSGCQEYIEQDKYTRPDWLPGKLFTTVSAQEDLSLFTELLKISGLDTVLDVSGSWSVFAPSDDAIKAFLSENNYATLTEVPVSELEKIAEYHVIQNPWSFEQLQSLGATGWRTGNSQNSDAYAYKRQTMYKSPVEKYWVRKTRNKEMIVADSSAANNFKKVFVPVRKYVPVFYDAYMDVYNLTSEDFNFYFGRAYERGNIYYAGAKVIRSDIFAENGFVHVVDKVVQPLPNAREILENVNPGESYNLFLEMIYWYYPQFIPNLTATFNQPEVRYGGVIDTLWDLNYNKLAFGLHNERTGFEGADVNQSLVRHNGLFIPTDEAFLEFVDGILTVNSGFNHWADIKSLPQDVADIIITQNLKSVPIYPSSGQYNNIFKGNGRYKQSEDAIIRRVFGSNCTFLGLNSYSPDRVFTSVTAPIFLRSEFTTFRLALQYSGALNEIANHPGELYFFPLNDYALNADSSLLLNWIDQNEFRYNFRVYNRDEYKIESQNSGTIRRRILNQVGTSTPDGSANKEFIRTLGGNYITWDHNTNTIQGTLPSTFGFGGYDFRTVTPVPLNEPTDNGKVWSVNHWFNFRSNNLVTVLSEHPEFYNLLHKSGLIDPSADNINFIDNNENYTIFVPSDEALEKFQADTLTNEELRIFLKHHFLKGEIIFTDNKKPTGKYTTANGKLLDIKTGPDVIEIPDHTGKPYLRIPEKENVSNIMISEQSVVTSVVHRIDKVLIPQ